MTVDTTVPVDRSPSESAAPRRGPISRGLVSSIHLYQMARSGRPTGCRYLPTCSAYAEEAILRFGPVRGLALATRRLVRCGPWGGHGLDPVPDRSSSCRH